MARRRSQPWGFGRGGFVIPAKSSRGFGGSAACKGKWQALEKTQSLHMSIVNNSGNAGAWQPATTVTNIPLSKPLKDLLSLSLEDPSGLVSADAHLCTSANLKELKKILTTADMEEFMTREDWNKAVKAINHELFRRMTGKPMASGGCVLERLQAVPLTTASATDFSASSPPEDPFRAAISAAFPRTAPSLEAVRTLLDTAIAPASGSARVPLKRDVADEIYAYEHIAAQVQDGELSYDKSVQDAAAVPASKPPSVAGMYLYMSYYAAALCMQTWTNRLQTGHIGKLDVDYKVLVQAALRLLAGQDHSSRDPKEAHTLRFLLTQRIAQIRTLSGADRLSPEEFAMRVAFSFGVKEFLTDIRLPLSEANPQAKADPETHPEADPGAAPAPVPLPEAPGAIP